MSWELIQSTGIWRCSRYADLDAVAINNLAEYGQPFSPYDPPGLFVHDFVPDFAHVILEMPQVEVMTNGYGRDLQAASFPIVSSFLDEELPFARGEYTFADLVELGFTAAADRGIAGDLYLGGSNGFTPGALEAADAAYVHGTVAAALMAGTRFVYADELRRVDAEMGALDDNWDFESDTIPDIVEVFVAAALGPDHYNLTGPIVLRYTGPGRRSVVERLTPTEEETTQAPEPAAPVAPPTPTPALPVNSVGGLSADHPLVAVLPVVVSPSTAGKGKNTIRMELIPVACWKLKNAGFAFASSFILPETRPEFAALAKLRAAHPGAPLSVFGHADPVGDDVFNKTLSGNRANSVYAVLTRDTARWEQLYSLAGASEGWGLASVQHMLTALGHNPGPVTGSANPSTTAAIQEFQGQADLTEDGVAGPITRAKLFAAYMDFLSPETLQPAEFLGRGADAAGKGDLQGCGEFNPVLSFSQTEHQAYLEAADKSERDAENEVNRRVMILLFRPGTSVTPEKWPCPRISEGIAGCRKRFWSDGEARRTPHAERREFEQTHDTFACRFYQRLVTGSPCEIVRPVERVFWIRLFDRIAHPLPFAPCLISENGKPPRVERATGAPPVANTLAPPPPEDAYIAIRDPVVPATVNLKWNQPRPGDNAATALPTPESTFEFEMDVVIDIPEPDGEAAAELRLRNLGYEMQPGRPVDIRSFQRDYRPKFPLIVINGTLDAPTIEAIRTVHDTCDPSLKGRQPTAP